MSSLSRLRRAFSSTLLVAMSACAGPSPLVTPDAGSGESDVEGITFAADNSVNIGTPVLLSVGRTPTTCGVMPAPFADDDLYSFGVYQFPIDGAGTFSLDFTTTRMIPVGVDLVIPLSDVVVVSYALDASGGMSSASYAQFGHSTVPGGRLDLEWSQGSQDARLLSGPLTMRVIRFPKADGELLEVHFRLGFADGRTLDFTARTGLVSGSIGCPLG
jgi:hypothetical protein